MDSFGASCDARPGEYCEKHHGKGIAKAHNRLRARVEKLEADATRAFCSMHGEYLLIDGCGCTGSESIYDTGRRSPTEKGADDE